MSSLLRSERGVALPIALLVMLVLSISVMAVVDYTRANARNASLSLERQNAKGLAEDGLNRAASILQDLVSTAEAAGNPADFGPVNLPAGSIPADQLPAGHSISWEQVSKTGTGTATQWTIRATGRVPNPTGGTLLTKRVQGTFYLSIETTSTSVPWRGVFAAEQGTRPLLSDSKAMIDTPLYVKEGYSTYSSTGVGTGPIPIEISGGKILTDDFRVFGRLAVTGSADVASIGASARVGGTGTTWKSDFPGALDRPEFRVGAFRVRDGCSLSTSGPWATEAAKNICRQTSSTGGPTQRFWLPCPGGTCTTTTVISPAYTDNVPNLTKPKVDFPKVYSDIQPGNTSRGHRCYANSLDDLKGFNDEVSKDWKTTNGAAHGFSGSSRIMDKDTTRNRDTGSFNLMPPKAYDCRLMNGSTEIGRLAWQPNSDPNQPGKLWISGDVYLDGDVMLGNGTASNSTHGWAEVIGKGAVHITGTVDMKGDYAGICGVADTTANRSTYGVTPASPDARGRCLNGKRNNPVPPTGPSTEPEIWDPGTSPDRISLVAGFSPHDSTILVQNKFQFQGSLYAGCTRYPESGGEDTRCTTNPPRSGLLVQGTATVKGPVVVDSVEVKNSGVIAGWTPLTDLSDTGVTSGETIRLTLLPGSWRG